MFVSCYISENFLVGRSGFLFLLFFFKNIVMPNNAAKSKNRCYASNFDIYLSCRISSDMS